MADRTAVMLCFADLVQVLCLNFLIMTILVKGSLFHRKF